MDADKELAIDGSVLYSSNLSCASSAEKVETILNHTNINSHNNNNHEDPDVIDWDCPTDPDNPQNWPAGKKRVNFGIVAVVTFVTPLASSMFAPGVEFLMHDFHNTNTELASFSVSCFLLGFAIGPLFMAPLSELYGRVPIYIVGNVFFFVFTVACAVAPNLASFIVFRVLAGTTGSVPLALGGGSIADLYIPQERGMALSLWALGPILGPVVGPVAGGFLAEAAGWRWVFWVIAIVQGVTTLLTIFFLRETYAPVLLSRKAKRLSKERNNTNIRSKYGSAKSPRQLFGLAIRRPLTMLLLDPIIFILASYLALLFGYLYLLFTTFPSIFANTYHFSAGVTGLVYLGPGIGSAIGALTVGMASDRIFMYLSRKHGEMKPEFRLPPMIYLAWTVPAGLFMYGWTAQKGVHWIAPIVGGTFFGFGFFCCMMAIQTYVVDAFGIYAASSLAAITVLRSVVGALLPLCGERMYEALGVGWGTSVLAFVALAFLPFPVLFYKYGERIRKRFARQY